MAGISGQIRATPSVSGPNVAKIVAAAVATAIIATACSSGTPNAPSTAQPPAPAAAAATLALSGQSNAEFLAPFLAATYPGSVVGDWESGLPIAFWQTTDRMWPPLAAALHQPLRAFVWYQGESDYREPAAYGTALAELLGRVRAEAHDPQLLLVVVRIAPEPAFAGVRAAQEAFVAGDAHALLVSTDDLPFRPGEVHLTDDGYRTLAARLIAALR